MSAASDSSYVCDSISKVVDRATKMCHLIPTRETEDGTGLADQLKYYIVKYHGIPRSFVSYR